MKVVNAKPPLWAEINAAFRVEGKPIIFAWGDTIYNPEGAPVGPELMAHEAVHGERQGDKPEVWWNVYLIAPAFRLEEEILAHRAEYQILARNAANRKQRRAGLVQVAKKLSSPLYGRLISLADAKEALR